MASQTECLRVLGRPPFVALALVCLPGSAQLEVRDPAEERLSEWVEPSVADQGAGKGEEGFVDVGAAFPAGAQASELAGAGNNGSTTAHSASDRSDGYRRTRATPPTMDDHPGKIKQSRQPRSQTRS